jgi:hypothetical protein
MITLRLDHERRLQHVTEPLVLNDRPHVELRQSVVALVSQVRTTCARFDPAVRVLEDIDVAMDQRWPACPPSSRTCGWPVAIPSGAEEKLNLSPKNEKILER